jgi:hypothetical protein
LEPTQATAALGIALAIQGPTMNKPNVTMDDLYLKANLLVSGIDFGASELMSELIAARKVRPGNGLYNYNRSSEKELRPRAPPGCGTESSASSEPVLKVLGQSNIQAPNEVWWSFNGARMMAEVRSNPSSQYRVEWLDGSAKLVNKDTETTIGPVDFPVQYNFNWKRTSHGAKMGEVVHIMGENALRVYPDMTCLMDKPGIKCRFCGVLPERGPLTDIQIQENIYESIVAAQDEMAVDHIFMSTGAFYDSKTNDFYAGIIAAIRRALRNPHAEVLFALTPPPKQRLDQVSKLIDAGLTDVSFNLEAWDDARWDLSNPQNLGTFKVRRGKKDHFYGFELVIARLGRGAAKSNFVGGLDTVESFGRGVDYLLDLGVIPSMTVFYLTPGSDWSDNGVNPCVEHFNRDPAGFLVESYLTLAEKTCAAGMKPHWARSNRISALELDAFAYLLGDPEPPSRVDDRRRAAEMSAAQVGAM